MTPGYQREESECWRFGATMASSLRVRESQSSEHSSSQMAGSHSSDSTVLMGASEAD